MKKQSKITKARQIISALQIFGFDTETFKDLREYYTTLDRLFIAATTAVSENRPQLLDAVALNAYRDAELEKMLQRAHKMLAPRVRKPKKA